MSIIHRLKLSKIYHERCNKHYKPAMGKYRRPDRVKEGKPGLELKDSAICRILEMTPEEFQMMARDLNFFEWY